MEKAFPALQNWRRIFHAEPETGWTEYAATYRITKELEQLNGEVFTGKDAVASEKRMGLPSSTELKAAEERALHVGATSSFMEKLQGGHTGAVIRFHTGRPGPHIAFRVDIDALPVREDSTPSHFPVKEGFASERPDRMHACAHDGHSAIGLALAWYISEHLDELCGTITVLFQPAEEGSRGAAAMVAKGWLDDADYFIGGHIGIQDASVGTIAAGADTFLATTKFNIKFSGKASHAGAKPEEGRNALLAAAAAVQNMHAIPRHSEGQTRINIGTLSAGSGRNVIPDSAYLEGETRGETTELDQWMFSEVKRIVDGAAQMYGVSSSIEVCGCGIAAECDVEFSQIVNRAGDASRFISRVHPSLSIGASEDATQMMKHVQNRGGSATYMLFGTPLAAGHHHPSFDYDETVLKSGLAAFIHTMHIVLEEDKQ
ncbi:amidohydrolase [Alteribacillus sp. HJP-4]|uniref:amidohydrolase n=1 Tax=Alteribacillus sp. HJP-4 TaxID=2775394 RepID=UPI0035CD2B12